jgi:DNA-binding transcriptional MerR regulator
MTTDESEQYSETSGTLARLSRVSIDTIRDYADGSLIDCIRLPTGQRLFKRSTAARVREIYRKRMANRGGPRGPKQATA